MSREDAAQATEANRLYWDTEASVGDIANQLGISRRALYEAIEPRPSGVPCPDCGTATVFTNRSAFVSGAARCPSCDTETVVTAQRREAASRNGAPAPNNRNGHERHRLPVGIGGAALMGVVVGAIATLLLTQRD